jgi:hypothetical protein
MTIPPPSPFQPYQNISSAEMNDILMQIRDGAFQSPFSVKALLHGQIDISDLSQNLQALLATAPYEQTATGDGSTLNFTLASVPLGGTDEVFLNGLRLVRGVDYNLIIQDIVFFVAPMIGDSIVIKYRSAQALNTFVMSSPVLSHKNIINIITSGNYLFVVGTNKGSSVREFARYDSLNYALSGTPVNVSSGTGSGHQILAEAGGYIWVIGSSAGSNMISRVDPVTMASTPIPVTADTGATADAIITDGAYIYVFLKGGTFAPNSIVKMDMTGLQVGTIASGFMPGPADTLDMSFNTSGFLFVTFAGSNQVRKYDVGPSGGLLNTFTFTNPIKMDAVLTKIYVLEGTPTDDMQTISATNVVLPLITFPFSSTEMEFDGADLWLASADTLRKLDQTGTVLQSLIPIPTLNIQAIFFGIGSIWVSYFNDTNAGPNISRIYPGLPGV